MRNQGCPTLAVKTVLPALANYESRCKPPETVIPVTVADLTVEKRGIFETLGVFQQKIFLNLSEAVRRIVGRWAPANAGDAAQQQAGACIPDPRITSQVGIRKPSDFATWRRTYKVATRKACRGECLLRGVSRVLRQAETLRTVKWYPVATGLIRPDAHGRTQKLPKREMEKLAPRTVCWSATWNHNATALGLENLVVNEAGADSMLLAFAEDGTPFRLSYRLVWDGQFRIREADLAVQTVQKTRSLLLRSDGNGHWWHAQGDALPELDGCIDIDIWPTPLTNSLPLWRTDLGVKQKREYRMAWISAPALTVEAKTQAYTRLKDQVYLFESLDGSGFPAELSVDEQLLVVDYPNLFVRVA